MKQESIPQIPDLVLPEKQIRFQFWFWKSDPALVKFLLIHIGTNGQLPINPGSSHFLFSKTYISNQWNKKCLMKFPKNELIGHSNNKQYTKCLMKFPKNDLIVRSNDRQCIFLLNNSWKCGTTWKFTPLEFSSLSRTGRANKPILWNQTNPYLDQSYEIRPTLKT
jgi:hypothetical protein